MKLKRFLSLAVVLAMVLTIVPAFGLTASAADMTDAEFLSFAKASTSEFDLTTANINWNSSGGGWNWDTDIERGMSNYGWTVEKNSTGTTNMACGGTGTNGKIQHWYKDEQKWQSGNKTDYVTMGNGFGAAKEWALFSFTAGFSANYGDIGIYDTNDALITAFRMGSESKLNIQWGHSGWGSPFTSEIGTFEITYLNTDNATQDSDGSWLLDITNDKSLVDILFRNYDGYYTATYFIDGVAKVSVKYADRNFSGLKKLGLKIIHAKDMQYGNISICKFAVYAGDYPSQSTEATVVTAVNALSVPKLAKNSVALPTSTTDAVGENVAVTWSASPEGIIDTTTGAVTAPAEFTKVELTPTGTSGTITVTGEPKTVTVFPASLAGSEYRKDAAIYDIGTENLIPNGDFSDGTTGWKNLLNSKDSLSADWSVRTEGDVNYLYSVGVGGGEKSDANVSTFWEIPNPTGKYLLSFVYHADTVKDKVDSTREGPMVAASVFQTNTAVTPSAEGGFNSWGNTGRFAMKDTEYHRVTYIIDASTIENAKYAGFVTRWLKDNIGYSFTDFELYEATVKETAAETSITYKNENGEIIETVTEKLFAGEVLTTEDKEVYFAAKTGKTQKDDKGKTLEFRSEDAGYYILKAATANPGETVEGTVEKVANKYGVLKDTGGKSGGLYGVDNDNRAFISSAGGKDMITKDANGESLVAPGGENQLLGGDRYVLMKFELPELSDGQKAKLTFNVHNWNINGGSCKGIRLIAYAVNEDDWTEAHNLNYDVKAMTNIAGTDAIFSEWVLPGNNTPVTFDVTDAVKAAKAADASKTYIDFKIMTPYFGAYVTDREKAVIGNTSPYGDAAEVGKAAYIEVVDANAFVVTTTDVALSKNGANVGTSATVTAEDDLRFCSDKDVYVENTKEVKAGNAEVGATEAAALTTVALDSFGIDLVNGAQVRVGKEVLAGDKKIADKKDSGIRFIGEITSAENSYYANNDEFGIAVAPKDVDFEANAVEIPAKNLQNDTVFTAAITNLKQTNYNRVFVAKPYVKIGGKTYYDTQTTPTTTTVERSIYEVASGLLTVEGELDDTASEYMVNVLNAYVNMTGARLTWNAESGIGVGTYANGAPAFFTATPAETVEVAGGKQYSVTLTATGKAKFFNYWNEFYRVNNSHDSFESAVKPVTTDVNADGSVTLTFVIPTATPAE